MKKRLVIGVSILTLALIGMSGCSSTTNSNSNEVSKTDRQEYAENAYQLGMVEALAVIVMPPEEAAEVQEIIHQAMAEELSLEEQEEVLDAVFGKLSKYITTDMMEEYNL